MHPVWKMLISLTALTMGAALHPPMPAMAQSRADLNRRLTDVELRVERLIVLLDEHALSWEELEAQLSRSQTRLGQLESEDARLAKRLLTASATRQQLLNELERENQRLKSRVDSMTVQRHMAAVAPWGAHDPTKERDAHGARSSRPSQSPYYPRVSTGVVMQFRDGKGYRIGEEPGGINPSQPVSICNK